MTSCCPKRNHKRNETQICTQSFNVVDGESTGRQEGARGGGAGGEAESRASTIRKSGVEIRNFARHHQRETFPTSWAIGRMDGRSSTAEPVDLVRWGQGRGALTPTQKSRRHCHLCRAASLLWWWFRMQPQSATWTALTAHSGNNLNNNNSNMNNNNNKKKNSISRSGGILLAWNSTLQLI